MLSNYCWAKVIALLAVNNIHQQLNTCILMHFLCYLYDGFTKGNALVQYTRTPGGRWIPAALVFHFFYCH